MNAVAKKSVEFVGILPVGNVLGEGAVWNEQQQAFWWTDIYGKRLFRYELGADDCLNSSVDNSSVDSLSHFLCLDSLTSWQMPEPVGCFGFVKGSDKLMVASQSGIGFWTPNGGFTGLDSLSHKNDDFSSVDSLFEFFAKPEKDRVGNRFNDGKTDPAGRFWAGAMVEDMLGSRHRAGLYRVNGSLTVERMMDDFFITNSLCWNKDGTVMYHADSPTDKLYRYDFDLKSGTASNKTLFAQTDGSCVPDGACTDTKGGVWVAHWQRNSEQNKVTSSRVVRYNPDGSESLVLEVPFSQCTCVAFGGPNMDLLLVTSAKHQLSAEQLKNEPNAGNVLIYRTQYRGVSIPAIQICSSNFR